LSKPSEKEKVQRHFSAVLFKLTRRWPDHEPHESI
jgi:hypothetical protein